MAQSSYLSIISIVFIFLIICNIGFLIWQVIRYFRYERKYGDIEAMIRDQKELRELIKRLKHKIDELYDEQ